MYHDPAVGHPGPDVLDPAEIAGEPELPRPPSVGRALHLEKLTEVRPLVAVDDGQLGHFGRRETGEPGRGQDLGLKRYSGRGAEREGEAHGRALAACGAVGMISWCGA